MTERVATDRKPPIRVLIADDNPDARLLIHTFLSLLGFEVCTAADGLEAVTRAEQFKPDVVFLDLWMPTMDGVEACDRLRKGVCPPPIPIFAVTADPSPGVKVSRCFDRVLTKPVDLDRLAELATQRAAQLSDSPGTVH
jgi:two-component system response regulator MprA